MKNGQMGELLAAQIPRLRRYARALTHNVEAADDLVQDCLERAWRKTHLYTPDTDLRAWLFTVMHNVFVNNLRRKRVVAESMSDRMDYEDPKPRGPERALDLRDVEAGLDVLSADQREVLLLVCLEEMTYEQVSAVLGVPVGTVMSRLHRARERLRHFMEGDLKPALRRVK